MPSNPSLPNKSNHHRSVHDLVDTLENWIDREKYPAEYQQLLNEVAERQEEVDKYISERDESRRIVVMLFSKLAGLFQMGSGYLFMGSMLYVINHGVESGLVFVASTLLLGVFSVVAGWFTFYEKQYGSELTLANQLLQVPTVVSAGFSFDYSTFLTLSGQIIVDADMSLSGTWTYVPLLSMSSNSAVDSVIVGINIIPLIIIYLVSNRYGMMHDQKSSSALRLHVNAR